MKQSSNDDVDDAIHGFFSKFADEKKFLECFHKNWVMRTIFISAQTILVFVFVFHKDDIPTLTWFFTFRDVGERMLRFPSCQ